MCVTVLMERNFFEYASQDLKHNCLQFPSYENVSAESSYGV
jgi:hypothetical protein